MSSTYFSTEGAWPQLKEDSLWLMSIEGQRELTPLLSELKSHHKTKTITQYLVRFKHSSQLSERWMTQQFIIQEHYSGIEKITSYKQSTVSKPDEYTEKNPGSIVFIPEEQLTPVYGQSPHLSLINTTLSHHSHATQSLIPSSLNGCFFRVNSVKTHLNAALSPLRILDECLIQCEGIEECLRERTRVTDHIRYVCAENGISVSPSDGVAIFNSGMVVFEDRMKDLWSSKRKEEEDVDEDATKYGETEEKKEEEEEEEELKEDVTFIPSLRTKLPNRVLHAFEFFSYLHRELSHVAYGSLSLSGDDRAKRTADIKRSLAREEVDSSAPNPPLKDGSSKERPLYIPVFTLCRCYILWNNKKYDSCTWEDSFSLFSFKRLHDSFHQRNTWSAASLPVSSSPVPTHTPEDAPIISKHSLSLHSHQKEALKWMETQGKGIIGDEEGMGKTPQMLAFLSQYSKKHRDQPHSHIVVVFGDDDINHWMQEAGEWTDFTTIPLFMDTNAVELWRLEMCQVTEHVNILCVGAGRNEEQSWEDTLLERKSRRERSKTLLKNLEGTSSSYLINDFMDDADSVISPKSPLFSSSKTSHQHVYRDDSWIVPIVPAIKYLEEESVSKDIEDEEEFVSTSLHPKLIITTLKTYHSHRSFLNKLSVGALVIDELHLTSFPNIPAQHTFFLSSSLNVMKPYELFDCLGFICDNSMFDQRKFLTREAWLAKVRQMMAVDEKQFSSSSSLSTHDFVSIYKRCTDLVLARKKQDIDTRVQVREELIVPLPPSSTQLSVYDEIYVESFDTFVGDTSKSDGGSSVKGGETSEASELSGVRGVCQELCQVCCSALLDEDERERERKRKSERERKEKRRERERKKKEKDLKKEKEGLQKEERDKIEFELKKQQEEEKKRERVNEKKQSIFRMEEESEKFHFIRSILSHPEYQNQSILICSCYSSVIPYLEKFLNLINVTNQTISSLLDLTTHSDSSVYILHTHNINACGVNISKFRIKTILFLDTSLLEDERSFLRYCSGMSDVQVIHLCLKGCIDEWLVQQKMSHEQKPADLKDPYFSSYDSTLLTTFHTRSAIRKGARIGVGSENKLKQTKDEKEDKDQQKAEEEEEEEEELQIQDMINISHLLKTGAINVSSKDMSSIEMDADLEKLRSDTSDESMQLFYEHLFPSQYDTYLRQKFAAMEEMGRRRSTRRNLGSGFYDDDDDEPEYGMPSGGKSRRGSARGHKSSMSDERDMDDVEGEIREWSKRDMSHLIAHLSLFGVIPFSHTEAVREAAKRVRRNMALLKEEELREEKERKEKEVSVSSSSSSSSTSSASKQPLFSPSTSEKGSKPQSQQRLTRNLTSHMPAITFTSPLSLIKPLFYSSLPSSMTSQPVSHLHSSALPISHDYVSDSLANALAETDVHRPLASIRDWAVGVCGERSGKTHAGKIWAMVNVLLSVCGEEREKEKGEGEDGAVSRKKKRKPRRSAMDIENEIIVRSVLKPLTAIRLISTTQLLAELRGCVYNELYSAFFPYLKEFVAFENADTLGSLRLKRSDSSSSSSSMDIQSTQEIVPSPSSLCLFKDLFPSASIYGFSLLAS
ncbi:Small heat shock protein RTM2-like protein, partial [Aduncisulcus paluster]